MLPVITTFSSCPFVTTVCFHLSVFARFLQLPGTKCFLLPTCRQNDFLGVISFSFEYPLTHNSSKSYDFLELLHPTQPKLQSALIIHCCKQLCRTSKIGFRRNSLKKCTFSYEMVTNVALPSTAMLFLRLACCILHLQGLPALHFLPNLNCTENW